MRPEPALVVPEKKRSPPPSKTTNHPRAIRRRGRDRRHARGGGASESFHRSTSSTRVIDTCSATWPFPSVGRPPSTRRVAESLLRSAGTTSGPAMLPTPQPHQNRRLGHFPYDAATNAGAMTKRKVSLLPGQEIYRRARPQYVDRGPQDIGLNWPRSLRHV